MLLSSSLSWLKYQHLIHSFWTKRGLSPIPGNFLSQIYLNQKEIELVSNKKDYSHNLEPKEKGEYAFCFKNLDGQNKILAFDIIELNDKFDEKVATKSFILRLGDLDNTIKSLHDN